MFDYVFHAFNSKANKYKDNPLKRPLSGENCEVIFEVFDRTIEYILGLQIREEKGEKPKNLCLTRVKPIF